MKSAVRLKKASKEIRNRDVRRRRWLLTVGNQSFHLTPDEVVILTGDCLKALGRIFADVARPTR
jgi:hypothetical protein